MVGLFDVVLLGGGGDGEGVVEFGVGDHCLFVQRGGKLSGF